MSSAKYKYLFGPVLSRRFGRSMGVDLVPMKTCTMNCVFCQLGHTTKNTTVRREYVPVGSVRRELAKWIATGDEADYITLSGSGEPTLHSRFGEIIDFIHDHTPVPVLLLTNSSLLHLATVRRAAAKADTVKISLGAWDQRSFDRLNRTSGRLSFAHLVKGLVAFRSEFKGVLIMEVFLVPGFNSDLASARKIARLAARIRPDRIQFNTAVRPPADKTVRPVSSGRMKVLSKLFHPEAELIPDNRSTAGTSADADGEAVLGLLCRHPCTLTQVSKAFNMPLSATRRHIAGLVESGRITARKLRQKVYYLPNERP